MTRHDICEFRSSFWGGWLAWLTTSTCANLIFFSTKKNSKIQRSRGGDLFTDFDAEAKEIYGATSVHSGVLSAAVALERELRSGSWKRVNLLEKEPKIVQNTNFWGFPILVFGGFFSMWAVKKGQFFIGYWLSMFFFWKVNITRNRWVQWNVTYIFFSLDDVDVKVLEVACRGGLGQGGWFFSSVDFHTNPFPYQQSAWCFTKIDDNFFHQLPVSSNKTATYSIVWNY